MLDFSSIALHLQIGIAEKIYFFDQKEFEFSSKHGKDVMNCTKHKAVVELCSIESQRSYDTVMFLKTDKYRYGKTCGQLLQFSDLPRFKVSYIYFESDIPPDSLRKLCERDLFVANEVRLFWRWMGKGVADFSSISDVFLKFFNVTDLDLDVSGPIDDDLFLLPKMSEISKIWFNSPEIPDERLLQLENRRIILDDQAENRISVTANLFFKEWFARKRNIEWFEIATKDYYDWGCIKEEIVFSGLPYSVIWKHREDQNNTSVEFQKFHGEFDPADPSKSVYSWRIDKNTMLYSIDREDRKLLAFVGFSYGREILVAQEYTELDDILRIE